MRYVIGVCGDRDGCVFLSEGMGKLELEPTMVITGGATGVDAQAKDWALLRGIQTVTLEANWKHHGKSAGPIRNRNIAETLKWLEGGAGGQKVELIAFPGGAGTRNMIRAAQSMNVTVRLCLLNPRKGAYFGRPR